jgi:hypothetical protein
MFAPVLVAFAICLPSIRCEAAYAVPPLTAMTRASAATMLA